MRFDSRTALIKFLSVVGSMGYQPPFINAKDLKNLFPGRMNYYLVVPRYSPNDTLQLRFERSDGYMVLIECSSNKYPMIEERKPKAWVSNVSNVKSQN